MEKKTTSRSRNRKNVSTGLAYIKSTFNNTMITITDVQGNTIAWSTAGVVGFSGSKQSTSYAAQVAAEDVARKAQVHGMKNLEILMEGPGSGKESVVRALSSAGFVITVMRDITKIPHNGPRARKSRRV